MMHVHLVFVTKYRRKVFTKEIMTHLEKIFSHVCQRFQSELVQCDGENDHVHLLINYPPTCPVSRLVNSLKGVSSRLIRRQTILLSSRLFGEKIFGLQAILQVLVGVHH
jgi:putative transposase